MWSTLSVQLLPVLLWLEVSGPNSVLSMDQTVWHSNCGNKWCILNSVVRNRTIWLFDFSEKPPVITCEKITCKSTREKPNFWERLRREFFGILPTESLMASTLSGHLSVNFLPELRFSAFLLRLLTGWNLCT